MAAAGNATGKVHLYEYETYHDAVTRLPHFIEDIYNQKRLHSALGYRLPDEFKEVVLTQRINATPSQILLTLSPIIGGAVQL